MGVCAQCSAKDDHLVKMRFQASVATVQPGDNVRNLPEGGDFSLLLQQTEAGEVHANRIQVPSAKCQVPGEPPNKETSLRWEFGPTDLIAPFSPYVGTAKREN